MRIKFIGKGGSGKSTLAASFLSYLSEFTSKPVLGFDADLNIHLPELLGLPEITVERHLSNPVVARELKTWLIGDNPIQDLGAFRKTTPPTRRSGLVRLDQLTDTPLTQYGQVLNNLWLFVVGTYQAEEVGATCYHNHLAVLESILNHTDDQAGYVVADMVAGVDAFAGTMHAQFDLAVLVLEPTRRSVEVYQRYYSLAKEAGVEEGLVVVANKIRSDQDLNFIEQHIGVDKVFGQFVEDEHIRQIDQTGSKLEYSQLAVDNQQLLARLAERLDARPDRRDQRLQKLWQLHEKYVSQAFVRDRYGDLTDQIDREFSFEK